MIDSGASGNYVRRCPLEGNQSYEEALQAQKGDTISVRLATRTLVTESKSVNLREKVFDFDSIERCQVLIFDSKYVIILGLS